MNSKPIATAYAFESDSRPGKLYQTLHYVDGTTSCDCPGWTRRAIRQCKHTRLVEMGLADGHCKSKVDYQTPDRSKAPRRVAALPREHVPGRRLDLSE